MAQPRRGIDESRKERISQCHECDPCGSTSSDRLFLITISDQDGNYMEFSAASHECAMEAMLRCFGAWNDIPFLIGFMATLALHLNERVKEATERGNVLRDVVMKAIQEGGDEVDPGTGDILNG